MAPDNIPADPTKFKQWADAACVDWSAELQAQAYRAWWSLEGSPAYLAADREAFLAAHRQFTRG